MAKTKKRSKKVKLSKKIDTQLLRDALVFIFLVLAFYTVMYVVTSSGGSRDCSVGQEIEEGCQAALPFSLFFLLPSILLAGCLQVGLKRMNEIKRHIKKVQK